MLRFSLFVISITLCFSASSKAQLPTVQDFLEMCEATARGDLENNGPSLCAGIVGGISFVMSNNCDSYHDGRWNPLPLLSMDESLNAIQAAQVFVNWARDNPQHWDMDVHMGVAVALSSSFPCG